jgi:hypothetical protein
MKVGGRTPAHASLPFQSEEQDPGMAGDEADGNGSRRGEERTDDERAEDTKRRNGIPGLLAFFQSARRRIYASGCAATTS